MKENKEIIYIIYTTIVTALLIITMLYAWAMTVISQDLVEVIHQNKCYEIHERWNNND